MEDFQEGHGREQTPAYGPSETSTRPMIYCPVRLVCDAQALLVPGDDARPAQLFYVNNTTNHVSNGIFANPFSHGNNYQNVPHQTVEQSAAVPNVFSRISENDQNTTNVTHSPVIFNMNLLNHACEPCNLLTEPQQNTRESRFRQDISCVPGNSTMNILPSSNEPAQGFFLQKIPYNCVQRNLFTQNTLNEEGSHQRVATLQQMDLEQELHQRGTPRLRKKQQQTKTQKMKPQQNFIQCHPLGRKVMKQNVLNHGTLRANSVHPNISQQNLFQQNILQQMMSLAVPHQKTPEKVNPSPTIVIPLQSRCMLDPPQIIINPKRNDYQYPCASTQAIKLKNLPPWVSKQMGVEPNIIDVQKIPETMNLYITIDNEDINRIANKKNKKSDVGSQVNSGNFEKIEDKPVKKRSLENEVVLNTASEQQFKEEYLNAEPKTIMNLTNDSTPCDLLRTYLKKPKITKNTNFYQEVNSHDASTEFNTTFGTTNERFKSNEITSTTSFDEGKVNETNQNVKTEYIMNKLRRNNRESSSTYVENQNGGPQTRKNFPETRTTDLQTDDAISSPSVNAVKPFNETGPVYYETGTKSYVDEAVNIEQQAERGTDESVEKLRMTNVTRKRMTKLSDKIDSSSQTVEVEISKRSKVPKKSIDKYQTRCNEGKNVRRDIYKDDDLFKKVTHRNSKLLVDKNDNAVNGDFPNFNTEATRSDNGIDVSDRIKNREESYILTHVIEGIVIQESNLPFPIITPMEKTRIEKGVKRKPPATIEKSETKSKKTNFVLYGFTPEIIKTWKIHQFVSHFKKIGCEGIANIFQEQELDGEALSLVSQHELVAVGVEEKLAKDLCDFMSAVKPKSYENAVDYALL